MSISATIKNIKIFADGASLPSMLESARDPRIAGFTTNPTLMRKAGISDYRAFAKEVLAAIKDQPISFEVFADDTSPRCSGRRARSRPGATTSTSRSRSPTPSASRPPRWSRELAARRREAERHRHLHAGAGARGGQGARGRGAVGRLGVRRPHRRHRPRSDAADEGGADDLPGRRSSRSSSCGPARASCSTSSRPPRSAATSSP